MSKRRARIIGSIASLVLVASLLGCATTTTNKVVSSYELAGVILKTGYVMGKSACESGGLPVDKCTQMKTIYNNARTAYVSAGDAIIVAFLLDDIVKQQEALDTYVQLSVTFTKFTNELIALLRELKVIKSGGGGK